MISRRVENLCIKVQEPTLHDHVDAGVIATESIGGYASEQGRITPFGSFDAQIGQYSIGQDFLADSVTRIALCVQSLVVHVPQNADWFLSLRLALQYSRFSTASGLIFQFIFELRRSWKNIASEQCIKCGKNKKM